MLEKHKEHIIAEDIIKAMYGIRKFQEDKLRRFMELAKLIWSEEQIVYFDIKEKGIPCKVILSDGVPDLVDVVAIFCEVCINEDVTIPIPIYNSKIDFISFENEEPKLSHLSFFKTKFSDTTIIPPDLLNTNTP